MFLKEGQRVYATCRTSYGTQAARVCHAEIVCQRPFLCGVLVFELAIAEVFGTALNGRSSVRQELAETRLPLQAKLAVLSCRGGEGLLKRLFEPLGYRRAGMHFFDDRSLEAELLLLVRSALESTGFWEKFQSDWVCLDCELMPWWVKAQALLHQKYAAAGAAARAALSEAMTVLEKATERGEQGLDVAALLERHRSREKLVTQLSWHTDSTAGLCIR